MKISKIIGGSSIALVLSLFLAGCGDPQKEVRKSLEGKGYDLAVEDLLVAASSGDSEGVDLFVEAGLDIDAVDGTGNTALIKASGSGHARTVEKILGLGADPRHVNGVGRDALLSASAKGFEEVARMLISRGADTSVTDTEGWSALSIAAYNGHSGVVSLLAGEASFEELDDALLVASFSGNARVINTLLNQGANINARSPESKTPLMIAAEGGKIEVARVLLQKQANPYAVDGSDRTAVNLAEEAGFPEMKDLILHPDTWGSSPEGEEIVEEMEEAQRALVEGGVEELLDEPTAETDELRAETGVVVASVNRGGSASTAAATESAATTESSTTGLVARAEPLTEPMTRAEPVSVGVAEQEIARSVQVSSDKTARANARKTRRLAKSKPIVALSGSTLKSSSPKQAPVKSMILAAYHEEPLPIVVDGVDGQKAAMRRLDRESGESVLVSTGSLVPGTPYRVKEVASKFVSSKEGKGRMVDVSRVTVENTGNGATHLLVKDVAGQSSDTYAILTAPNSQYRYVVKAGDVFSTSQPGAGATDYQVLDVRANGVVIKDLRSEEVVTIARDGIIAP
ncbi:MAG: ankyrin repeat domain-containing protein [Verrucomicrobiales bacterium]